MASFPGSPASGSSSTTSAFETDPRNVDTYVPLKTHYVDNQLIDLRIELPESSDIVADVAEIVSQSRCLAYAAVDVVLLQRNWLIGKRIAEEELQDSRKENYGLEIIETLSKELSKEFGKRFDKVNLYYYLRFFKAIQIFFTQRVNNLSPAGAIPYDLICGNGVPIWA